MIFLKKLKYILDIMPKSNKIRIRDKYPLHGLYLAEIQENLKEIHEQKKSIIEK